MALDPQLICYSWMTGISEVVLVAFVRKRGVPQSNTCGLRSPDEQRRDFEQMVEATASRIEAGEFLPHSGIRFRRTAVSAARIWACAWETSRLSNRNSFASREPPTLIGLTTLTGNGRPLVAPKLNRRRALLV